VLVGRQCAPQSKITNYTHRVDHRLPDLNPEVLIDDLLKRHIDLELPQHLPHCGSEVLASKAGDVYRCDSEQELLGSGPGPGADALDPAFPRTLEYAISVEQHPIQVHGSAAYPRRTAQLAWSKPTYT
jgi:hypothetical protein